MILGLIIGLFYLFWDFLYWTKWTSAVIALWVKKKTQNRRFDLYDYEVENPPEKLGILVPKEERYWESPLPDEHLEKAADEIFVYGVNSKSEALIVRISRSCNDESEAWVYLKLADGRWYQLEQTKGYQRNFDGQCTSFSCGGLQMYYLCAMRRWRIVYCGILRERKDSNETEKKEVFVKFTCIWTASSEVYDASSDLDVKATAGAMAEAKWNSPFPPIEKADKIMNFYSQSGIINGTVSIEDEPEIEMYLFGERIRYLGEGSYLSGSKFKLILGVVPESGLIIHLEKASVPDIFHNLYFGFIVNPTSQICVVQDGVIVSRMSDSDKTGRSLTAMFKADKQYELCGKFIGDSLNFTSEIGFNSQMEMVGINFEIDGCKGSGFMISGEISKQPQNFSERKLQKITSSLPTNRPLTVYFTDEASHFSELAGGKGASLGKLTKLSLKMKSEFIVPKGIIVTTEAYSEFLTSELIGKIGDLKNIVYGSIKGNIPEACKIVQSAVECGILPEKVKKEIEYKLNRLFGSDINQLKFAVRSSATGEDTEQMSAAGQMETFLGIQGLREIFSAIKKCWASQFGYVPVEYKRQNGQILNSSMAIVIQEMVECETSGVLFTCDPVTNNPSVVVITGNYGLGESVVSGSEEPDTIVLRKLQNEDVQVTSVDVGSKQHRIVLKDTSTSEEKGTATEDVPEDKRNECCISDEMALKLGKLSLKIERNFKSPRDIEWGIKNNTIYLLQSRPITTGASISDYEIKHEFDGPLRCEGDYFTLSNIGESMPGAASPLGIDVINKFYATVFQKKSMKRKQRNTFLQTKYFPVGIVPFYNHVTMGVIDLITRTDDGESMASQSMMIGVFGRVLDDPDLKIKIKHRKYPPMKTNVVYQLITFLNLFFAAHGVDEITKHVFSYQIPAKNGKTSREIFHLLMDSCNHFNKPFDKLVTSSEVSAMWNLFLFSALQSAKGGMDTDVYSDFAKLLASSSKVESADVPSAIQLLAQSIIRDLKSQEFREMPVEDALKWLETSTTLVGNKYRQFMKRHGHRCLKEIDMYSIPWSENPKPLIKLLQNISGSFEDVKEKKEAYFSDILPHLSIPLNLKFRLLIKFILPNCRRAIRHREVCKSNFVKTMDNTRKGFQHLSKSMVAEGYLPEMDLLFFLTIDEINEVLETRNPRIIARAKHRRKLFPLLDSLIFPEISKGLPVPINEQQDEHVEFVADLTMKGIPVSQGTAKGYARVVVSLKEAAELKRGEILITQCTDIGWSPYFPILAGVVTELGGLISHGAVVSREYGLPCVVGLHGATKHFVTGDYILVDGNKGILQRLSPPEN